MICPFSPLSSAPSKCSRSRYARASRKVDVSSGKRLTMDAARKRKIPPRYRDEIIVYLWYRRGWSSPAYSKRSAECKRVPPTFPRYATECGRSLSPPLLIRPGMMWGSSTVKNLRAFWWQYSEFSRAPPSGPILPPSVPPALCLYLLWVLGSW